MGLTLGGLVIFAKVGVELPSKRPDQVDADIRNLWPLHGSKFVFKKINSFHGRTLVSQSLLVVDL